MIYSEILQATEGLELSEVSELTSEWKQMHFMAQVLQSLLTSVSESLAIYSRRLEPYRNKLEKGFASLPNELVSRIFHLVVHSDSAADEDKTLRAVSLSHISRKHRRIALGDKTLWSTIRLKTNMTKEMMGWLLSRSGNTIDLDIEITFDIATDTIALRTLMDLCAPTAPRWRSLEFINFRLDNGRRAIFCHELGELMEQQLVLPRLHELRLFDLGFSTHDYANICSWDAPNLRVLNCSNHIPSPSFPITTFTTFMLELLLFPNNAALQINNLASFLSSKPNILEFLLKLEIPYVGETPVISTAVSSSIKSIAFNISGVDAEKVRKFYGPIVKSWRASKLEVFQLYIDAPELGTFSGVEDFSSALPLLLPDRSHHSLLKAVLIDIGISRTIEPLLSLESKSATFNIPLDEIPYASYLEISTPGQVTFSRPGTDPSPLRGLKLFSCADLDTEGLRLAVQSLKLADVWDTLECIAIQNCKLLGYTGALWAVGPEKLWYMGNDM